MADEFDYIVIGQGLAGTCLAFQLLAHNKKVLIIDEWKDNTSTKVAAGLYNPVTGRKMVLTWKANKLFPYLQQFYASLEEKLNIKFLHETTIYRPFVSLEEQNEWMGKSTDQEYAPYVDRIYTHTAFGNHVRDMYGGLALKNCGYLDLPLFLSTSRDYFQRHAVVWNESFDENTLETEVGVRYKNIEAKKIIFCTGISATQSPYFNWLPFKNVKGEILEITPQEAFEIIYNRGVFIMPRSNGKCIVGATYETKDLTTSITEKGRNTLIEKLESVFKLKYEVSNQRVGIRPATRDRRPFVGGHPEKANVGIFNGLGAKGVTLAPYFSRQMADFLVNGEDVDNEVNVSRYYSLYFK